jgi:hypothetical protein
MSDRSFLIDFNWNFYAYSWIKVNEKARIVEVICAFLGGNTKG